MRGLGILAWCSGLAQRMEEDGHDNVGISKGTINVLTTSSLKRCSEFQQPFSDLQSRDSAEHEIIVALRGGLAALLAK